MSEQPAPANPADARLVLDDVTADARKYGHDTILPFLESRAELGRSRYGCDLAYDNGRDPVMDGVEELADAVMYFRQAIGEGERQYTGQYLIIMGVLDQCLAKILAPAQAPEVAA